MRPATLLAAAMLLASAAPLHAQERDDTMVLQRPIRGWVGGNLYYARPVGDFANFIDHGWGGDLHGTLLVDQAGVFGLRFDASFMNYGRERVNDVCALPTVCRVLVDVVTTNNIAFVGAGPQLMAPSGAIRPYVAGQAGWTFIWTNSSIEDNDDDDETTLDTQNLSDNTFSYGGAAGILIPVSAGRTPVAIDFGARYLRNGNVRYLREGDIIDNPSGPPYLNIQRSRADLVTYYLGVSIGLR
ncbi:MAG TPA: hypothetical protein VFS08_11735 [Gemmatimonadaceae bacterium]|nr:hypothetical protein [Gemmatimonadaceae bacterium]